MSESFQCEKCGENEGTEFEIMVSENSNDDDGHMMYYNVYEDSAVLCEECVSSSKRNQIFVRLIAAVLFIVVAIYFTLVGNLIFGGISGVIGLGALYLYWGVNTQNFEITGQNTAASLVRSELPDSANVWNMKTFENELQSDLSTLFDPDNNKIIPESTE